MTDTAELLASFAQMKEPVTGVALPMCDPAVDGAKTTDAAQGMSRYLEPLDYAAITLPPPPTSWTTAGEVWRDLIATLASYEGMATAANFMTQYIQTRDGDPGAFLTGALEGYANYIHKRFNNVLEGLKSAWQEILVIHDLAPVLALLPPDAVLRQLLAHLADPTAAFMEVMPYDEAEIAQATAGLQAMKDAYDALAPADIAAIAERDGGPEVLAAIEALVGVLMNLHEAYVWLRSLDFPQIWEYMGEGVVLLLECLRDSEAVQSISLAASVDLHLQPAKLGEAWGVAVGVVMWEIIEDVATGLFEPLKLLTLMS